MQMDAQSAKASMLEDRATEVVARTTLADLPAAMGGERAALGSMLDQLTEKLAPVLLPPTLSDDKFPGDVPEPGMCALSSTGFSILDEMRRERYRIGELIERLDLP